MSKQLKAVGSRLICAPVQPETKTAGGILVPTSASQSDVRFGLILDAGPDITNPDIAVGNSVMYSTHTAMEVAFAGEDLIILDADAALAVLVKVD